MKKSANSKSTWYGEPVLGQKAGTSDPRWQREHLCEKESGTRTRGARGRLHRRRWEEELEPRDTSCYPGRRHLSDIYD